MDGVAVEKTGSVGIVGAFFNEFGVKLFAFSSLNTVYGNET